MNLKSLLREILDLTRKAGTTPVDTGIPRVLMIRGDVPRQQLAAVYEPMLGFVVQGAKLLEIGEREIRLRGPSYFLLPTHVPVSGRVQSSRAVPYLSLGLMLDHEVLRDLLADLPLAEMPGPAERFAACPADPEFVDAWLRMMRLLKTPRDVPALAPVYEREILYRVLRGPQGGCLRQIGLKGSSFSKISETVQWLRRHFARPIDIEGLARQACMGVTTFHRQFKRTTGMSPIQFQKRLRLLEARNLLALESYRVASAAYEVGYESPSQFNREYSRFFGTPPARDAMLLTRIDRGDQGAAAPERRRAITGKGRVVW